MLVGRLVLDIGLHPRAPPYDEARAYDRRVPTVLPLRLLIAGPLLGAVLTVALSTVAAPAFVGGAGTALAAPASSTPSPGRSPTRAPATASPSPTGIVPLPSRTPSPQPSETATQEPTEEPTATATRTRVRTSSPRPRRTSDAPVIRETPDSNLPPVTGGFGVGTASPGLLDGTPDPTVAPTKKAVASSSTAAGDKLTRLIQLIVAAGVLLGIGGGVGLYLTRS